MWDFRATARGGISGGGTRAASVSAQASARRVPRPSASADKKNRRSPDGLDFLFKASRWERRLRCRVTALGFELRRGDTKTAEVLDISVLRVCVQPKQSPTAFL